MGGKVGGRAIEGRRGRRQLTGTNGGSVTYREEGRGDRKGKGHEAQKPLTGKPFCFLA